MNEDLLGFIWQFQYFDAVNLKTEEGETIQIIRTGHKNTNAGPDFSNSRIRIDGVEWIGSVEIHTKSSDWLLHQHSGDGAYESVIMHVVWENDIPIFRPDKTLLPVLSLKGLVRLSILERYASLMNVQEFYASPGIPCQEQFPIINELQKFSMLDRVLLERLDKKASKVLELYHANQQDWEETTYQWLGQHFGFKLNDPAFLRLTQIIPLKILQKHRSQFIQLEALLFGTAGLIPNKADDENPEDLYIETLRREYQFLSNKYGTSYLQMNTHEFKFLRLRPAGFPTIRISQFADLITKNGNLFSSIISAKNVQSLHRLFNLKQSDYWMHHFQFGKLSKSQVPVMGKDAVNLLIINAVVPLLVAYSKQRQQPDYLDKALNWLSEIPAENNRITREWETLGMKVKTAADSQSLIEWYNHYCTNKKCLECTVGAALVRST
ncbi:DUF2851 family protein [Dyadobacter frigoris]|uniref:DUF2851 family protein n=1 Tax=Dyadobacter frigoris TaxID=2576211 RepID=A0A4U6CXC7_9BACT|nr:DUF2851 family protein [Dyadobacter frigoris]TKT88465.1 DUF2851 family protein [Dyadobacter frigoris]GLU54507.1 hypothetical protein Dfri01_39680 [Dyadobacter frigoris]